MSTLLDNAAVTRLLLVSWRRCWSGLSAMGDGAALRQTLLDAYAEPQRHYHTLQHLAECISHLQENLDLALEPAEVEIALWFHDAIYDIKASNNEQLSADWAVSALREAQVAADKIEHVRAHILATKHAAQAQSVDQQLLVDIDLAILGASPARFAEYESQVQAEYAWVPAPFFRAKRREILSEFLSRVPLYNTPKLRNKLEQQAQANLTTSIEKLRNSAH